MHQVPRSQRARAPRLNAPRQTRLATIGQQSIGTAVTSVQPLGPTQSITVSGDDSIYKADSLAASGAPSGKVLAYVPINPSVAERLAGHAALYQNVRYNRLKAYVNGQASTNTTGSMILAFCSDPSDVIPSKDTIAWARSQRCNGSAKYWETMSIDIPHNQLVGPFGGAFKNNAGKSIDERTYSPGFLALIAVSPPNQVTPVELMLRWEVTLSDPTLNRDGLETSIVESLVNFGMQGNNTADTPIDWNLKVFAPDVEVRDLTGADFSPALEADTYYILPGGQLMIAGNTGASGAPEFTEATHIGLKASNVVFYKYQISTDTFIEPGGLTAQPTSSGAPTFRSGLDWRVDPQSPSRGTPAVGFRRR